MFNAIRRSTANISAPMSASTSESLEQFLGRLPDLWRQGEVRATHEAEAQNARKPRTWRTHPDPFEGVSVLIVKPDRLDKMDSRSRAV